MLDARLHSLILSIYDAGLQRASWAEVARGMVDVLGMGGATLVLHNTSSNSVLSSEMVYHEHLPVEDILGEYAAEWHIRNPQVLFERARPGALFYHEAIDPQYNSDSYPDFTRWRRERIGIVHQLTGYCRPSERLTFAFAFSGTALRSPDLSPHQLELFTFLMSHLRQAVDLAYRFGSLENRAHALESLLNGSADGRPRAMALLDCAGRPVFVSRHFELLARQRDGIFLSHTGLRFANREDSARFAALQKAGAKALSGEFACGGSFAAARPSGKRPYIVHVAPVPPTAIGPLSKPIAAIMVSIVDPEEAKGLSTELLMQAMGLTRGEGRVAIGLTHGDGLDEIASKLQITVATVRSHLKAIYAKTGTSRQAELVAVLSQLV